MTGSRCAALVPIPRVHLTRFHGVLAPHAPARLWREDPEESRSSPRGTGGIKTFPKENDLGSLLKRVFKIEIERCRRCGGRLKVIAAIVKPDVIEGILKHLGLPTQPRPFPPARAPPQAVWEF